MKNSEKYIKAFNYFKKSYKYRMGGTQTVILPNGKSKEFDDRSYYEGRGKKYNSTINHDIIGDVIVTKKEYSAFLKHLKDQEKAKKEREQKKIEAEKRYNNFKAKGIYEIKNVNMMKFIVLSQKEQREKFFDAERLAKTLDISVKDASLLNSGGKTYVFAKTSKGNIIELYHPSLDCNDLNISVDFNPTKERIESFNHDQWSSAPFSREVGMTNNKNHFVC